MLDIVDAQLGGFAVGDRAEMAGNAEAALVGGFNYFFNSARVMCMKPLKEVTP